MNWALFLTRPFLIGYAVVGVLAAGGLWVHEHDKRVLAKDRAKSVVATAEAQMDTARAQTTAAVAGRDSAQAALQLAQSATNNAVRTARAAGTAYSTERARVNITAPQPAGTPPGTINVPISFVQSTDSMMTAMRELVAQQQREREAAERRIAADSVVEQSQKAQIAILTKENAALSVLAKNAGGGIQGKVKAAAVGYVLLRAAEYIIFHR